MNNLKNEEGVMFVFSRRKVFSFCLRLFLIITLPFFALLSTVLEIPFWESWKMLWKDVDAFYEELRS